jgi:hypothetical protein
MGGIEFRRDQSLYLNYSVKTEWLDGLERFLKDADMAFEKAPRKTPDSMIGLLSFITTNSAQEWSEEQIVFKEEEAALTYVAEIMLRAPENADLTIALDAWDAYVALHDLPEVKAVKNAEPHEGLSDEQVAELQRNPLARLFLMRERWLRGELKRWRAALMTGALGRIDECSLN